MNKAALEKFAPWARRKLIEDTRFRAELYGITSKGVQTPDTSVSGVQKFEYAPGMFTTISGRDIARRERLVSRVHEVGYEQLIEENAYAWFNRLIAIRFMEVHGYLDARVLSSETVGKAEPDIIEQALDLNLGLSDEEKQLVLTYKQENKIDDLFKLLFIKQCNTLSVCLPGMFQNTEDYSELLFPLSYTNPDGVIKRLISDIAEEDFSSVEIIGWLYQYYNSELKDDTFARLKKNQKITKERIPSATQLFTPEWIVRYMVENSLGRLWLEGHPNDKLKANWKYYLDEAKQESEVEAELEKIRAERKNLTPEDITILDPCMGSGHILVYAFDVLMQIYESVGYQQRDAAKLILEKNLYGLDIDDRAGQLAYFAVMMKAREYNRRILTESITPNLCSIQEANIISDNILRVISNNDPFYYNELVRLKNSFIDAKEYGSIVEIQTDSNLNSIISLFSTYLKNSLLINDEECMRIQDIIIQAKILSKKYDIVITNPPYMGSSGMGSKLSDYLKRKYPESKTDLFAVFIEYCQTKTRSNSYYSMITQQSWMFLSSFGKLRSKMLQNETINMAHLGARAFEEIGGEVVQTSAFIRINSSIPEYVGTYTRLVDPTTQNEKEYLFLSGKERYYSKQINYSKIPGNIFAYWLSNKIISLFNKETLGNTTEMKSGMSTTDNPRFLRYWYEVLYTKIDFNTSSIEEVSNSRLKWFPYNKGGQYRKWYGNRELIVNWENNGYDIKYRVTHNPKDPKTTSWSRRIFNTEYFFRESLTWSNVSTDNFSVRYLPKGSIFDSTGCSLFTNLDDKYYILGFMNSNISNVILQALCPTIHYDVGPISKLPFIRTDNPYPIENYSKDNIYISKNEWDSFETSWDFQTHPFLTYKGKSIKESFENWKNFADEQFQKLKSNEEELNRIFIEIYGLEDELTPEEDDKDVTICRADLTRDVKSFISYAVGCMFGRYSLDVPGLAYAGGDWDASKYKTFIPDEDGIIPITDRDYFPDDIVGRFIEFFKVTYGEETLEENLDFVADALGTKGKTSREIIRNYFLKGFYEDHLKIYQKRPIYWLFDSGKENGFKALIYLHRYNRDTVGRIRTDYLHETQKKIEGAIHQAEFFKNQGTPAQQKKANDELSTLHKQLEETQKYDAAIASIALQRIDLDLDDGVKVNYEKFQNIDMGGEGKMKKTMNLLAVIK